MAGPSGNESNHVLDGLTVRGGLAVEGKNGTQTYLNADVVAQIARQAALLRGMGLITETVPLAAASTTALLTSGTIYAMGVGLLAGDVVSNLTVGLHTIGVTVTLMKVGIYSKTGTLLVASSDQSSVMNGTTGTKTISVTPYTITSDDLYYAAAIAVGAGTQPTLIEGKGSTNAAQAIGSGVALAATLTAQSDLVASATFLANSNAREFWIGVS